MKQEKSTDLTKININNGDWIHGQAVLEVIKQSGIEADWDYPGFISIRHKGMYFAAGTLGGHWSVDYYMSDQAAELGHCHDSVWNESLTTQSSIYESAKWLLMVCGATANRHSTPVETEEQEEMDLVRFVIKRKYCSDSPDDFTTFATEVVPKGTSPMEYLKIWETREDAGFDYTIHEVDW